jgi:hypothetical protein
MARSGPTIADTALQLIQAGGPMRLGELAAGVVAAGRTRAKDPIAAVRAAIDIDHRFIQAVNGRWCSLADQLEGAMLTTTITAFEQRDEIVMVRTHLAPMAQLAPWSHQTRGDDEVHLDLLHDYFDLPWPTEEVLAGDLRAELGTDVADLLLDLADELGVRIDDEDRVLADLVWETRDIRLFHGPRGWLAPVRPKQLLGLRVRSGRIETVALDRRELRGIHVQSAANRVAALARRVIGPDPSWFEEPVIAVNELLELVVTEAPELLRRPLPPFDDLIRLGGLEVEGGLVGHPATDWREARWWTAPTEGSARGIDPVPPIH